MVLGKDKVDLTSVKLRVWINNMLYILNESDCHLLASPTEWINNKIITAAQKLLL